MDLLVLTSLDQLLLVLKTLFSFLKTSYINKEVSRTEPSPSVSVPCSAISFTLTCPLIFLKVEYRGMTVHLRDDSVSQCLLPYKATITRIENSPNVRSLSIRPSDSDDVRADCFRPDTLHRSFVVTFGWAAARSSFPQVGIFSLSDVSPQFFSPEIIRNSDKE